MVNWIKEHPYLFGALIVGVIILYIVYRNSKNASAAAGAQITYAGSSDAVQAATIQSGEALQGAQLAAQAQIAGYNAQANIVQLEAASADVQAQLAAGVQNYQTAGETQYALATLGFSPSISPFGLTVPIGAAPAGSTAPAPVSTPTPIAPAPSGPTQPVTLINQQTTDQYNAQIAAQQNNAIAAALEAQQYAADQGGPQNPTVGSGGPVTVQSVPVYGATPGLVVGHTPTETIPTSAGENWSQYYAQVAASQPQVPGGSLGTTAGETTIATQVAANVTAQNEYLMDPLSCHNRVCNPAAVSGAHA